MGELVNVLAVNLELLSSYGISRAVVCADRLRGLRATRSQGVKEFVLSFGWMGSEGRCRASVFLLQIVPLFQSALYFLQVGHHTCMLVFCAPR